MQFKGIINVSNYVAKIFGSEKVKKKIVSYNSLHQNTNIKLFLTNILTQLK